MILGSDLGLGAYQNIWVGITQDSDKRIYAKSGDEVGYLNLMFPEEDGTCFGIHSRRGFRWKSTGCEKTLLTVCEYQW